MIEVDIRTKDNLKTPIEVDKTKKAFEIIEKMKIKKKRCKVTLIFDGKSVKHLEISYII